MQEVVRKFQLLLSLQQFFMNAYCVYELPAENTRKTDMVPAVMELIIKSQQSIYYFKWLSKWDLSQ